jgi:polyhydroxybutyrate depolymerase
MTPRSSVLNRRVWASRIIGASLSGVLTNQQTANAGIFRNHSQRFLESRLCVEGRIRTYLIYFPTCYDQQRSWPVVMAFHPFLYPNRVFERYAKLSEAADRNGYVLVLPQGLGHGFFRSFNAGLRDDPNDPDDVAYTNALITDMQTRVNADISRIYAIGMSNGGMFAHLLAQSLPGVLAGLVTVSGTPAWPISRETPPTPVLMVHGTADPITPWTGPGRNTPKFLHFQDVDESFQQWCFVNRVQGQARQWIYDEPGDKTQVQTSSWFAPDSASADTVLMKIVNGGHRWPALRHRPYIPFTGKQSTDLDFNQVAWEFLSRQKRDL